MTTYRIWVRIRRASGQIERHEVTVQAHCLAEAWEKSQYQIPMGIWDDSETFNQAIVTMVDGKEHLEFIEA